MIRRQMIAVAVMLGVVCGIAPSISAWAQDQAAGKEKGQRQGERGRQSSVGGDDGSSDPSQKVDRALQTYRQRMGQNQEHTRKDIDRLRKELTELTDLRYDMAISLAELRADMTAQAMLPGQGGLGGGFRSLQATGGSEGAGGQGGAGQGTGDNQAQGGQMDERQAARADALHRELQVVLQQLNSDVNQARTAVEGLATQLQTQREQQRQAQQQRQEQQKKQQEEQRKQQEQAKTKGSQ